jgi:RHS repeat-associated protein
LYGQNGIIGFEYNGVSYYYITNLQGDVMKVIDANGNVVASYVYDSWGKIIGQTGSLADVNPIRYRGYYYDQETQLYYLNARYYDPETGRFISADIVAEGGNLYAYCQNDPINRTDDSVYLSEVWKKRLTKIAIGAVLAVAAVAITVATGGAALPIIASIAVATASGAVMGGGIAAVQHRIETGSWDGALNAALEGAIDGAVDGFLTGSAFALVGTSLSAINAIKTAKQGITIGKGMDRVKVAAQINKTATYKPMRGYNLIEKISPKLADKLSIYHNKVFINRMMHLNAKIYDVGLGTASSAGAWYGMELAEIAKKGYKIIQVIF